MRSQGGAPINGLSVLIKRDTGKLFFQVHAEKNPGEHTVRGKPPISQGKRPRNETNHANTLIFGHPGLQNWEK